MITSDQSAAFIIRHRLPARFVKLIDDHYDPLAVWIFGRKRGDETLVVGINGAQGTGKSTLAAFIKVALESNVDWHVAVMSIDDFYLTQAERAGLADEIHPLLRTRGAPGTHDIEMLSNHLDRLISLDADSALRLPRFDKARDDRADRSKWHEAKGTVDLVLIEGWCVGSEPQHDSDLIEPINALEKTEDTAGTWRAFVNDKLRGEYAQLFARLDVLIFLQAPDFAVVHRWRLLQEQKLAECLLEESSGIMDSPQVARFIQHYERVTRSNLKVLPQLADVVLKFNDSHECMRSRYN